MYSNWGEAAREQIAAVMAELPADADLDARRKALRAHAHDFHGGTSWGRKVWPKEVRRYLEKHHGLPPRTPADVAPTSGLFAKLHAPDITFPFRPTPQPPE